MPYQRIYGILRNMQYVRPAIFREYKTLPGSGTPLNLSPREIMILPQDIVPSTCQYHVIQGANDNVHGEHPPHHASLKYIRPRMSEQLYKNIHVSRTLSFGRF